MGSDVGIRLWIIPSKRRREDRLGRLGSGKLFLWARLLACLKRAARLIPVGTHQSPVNYYVQLISQDSQKSKSPQKFLTQQQPCLPPSLTHNAQLVRSHSFTHHVDIMSRPLP